MYYVPDKHLEPPEDVVFCVCDHCGRAIYVGEKYLDIDSYNYHMDCINDYVEIAGE